MPTPIGVYEDPAYTLQTDTDLAVLRSQRQFSRTADSIASDGITGWGMNLYQQMTDGIAQAHQMVDQLTGNAANAFDTLTGQVDSAHATTDQAAGQAMDRFSDMTGQIDAGEQNPPGMSPGLAGMTMPPDTALGVPEQNAGDQPAAAATGPMGGATAPLDAAPAPGGATVGALPMPAPGPGSGATPPPAGDERGTLGFDGTYYQDPHFGANVKRYSNEVGRVLGPEAARLAVAQARLETGNGQQMSKAFNYGNIQNTDANPKGGPSYRNPEEAGAAWAQFLQQNPRYQGVVDLAQHGAPLETLAQGLKTAGYATDKDYVAKVVGAAQPAVDPPPSPNRNGYSAVPDQYHSGQLTDSEAYAACGPAAAVGFAREFGRNPTMREAVDLAKQTGWTSDGGMNGVGNEQTLLKKMGIPTLLDTSGDWQRVAQDATNGNPVVISTNQHYFMADNYDPTTGKYHVGYSGTAMPGGSEWMTQAEMEKVGRGFNGALFADHPQAEGPSITERITGVLHGAGQAITAGAQGVAAGVKGAIQGMTSPSPAGVGTPDVTDPLSGASMTNPFGGVGGAIADKAQSVLHGVSDKAQELLAAPLPLPTHAGENVGAGVTATQVGTDAGTLAEHLHTALDPNAAAGAEGDESALDNSITGHNTHGFFNRLGTAVHTDLTVAGTPGRLAQEAVAAMHGYKSAAEDPYFNTPVVGGARAMVLDPTTYIGGGTEASAAGRYLGPLTGKGPGAAVADIVGHVNGALDSIGGKVLGGLGLTSQKLEPALAHIAERHGPEMVDRVAEVLKDGDRIRDLLLDPMQASSKEEKLAANTVKMAKDQDIIDAAEAQRTADLGVTVNKMEVAPQKYADGQTILTHTNGKDIFRGTPVGADELPDTLYHVTTDFPSVQESGRLLANPPEGATGLGRGDGLAHQGVSLTTSAETAEQIRQDLLRAGETSRLPKDSSDVEDLLRRYATEDETAAKLEPGALSGAVDEAMRSETLSPLERLKGYTNGREARGGPENTILIGPTEKFAALDPDRVRTIAVPKDQLPSEPLTVKDPLGTGHLGEVRVYGDVPWSAGAEPQVGTALSKAVLSAVESAAPDSELLAAASKPKAKPVQPLQAGQAKLLGHLDKMPPAVRDALVREAGRTLLGLNDHVEGLSEGAHYLARAVDEKGLNAVKSILDSWVRQKRNASGVADVLNKQLGIIGKRTGWGGLGDAALDAKGLHQMHAWVNELAQTNVASKTRQASIEAALSQIGEAAARPKAGGALGERMLPAAATSDLLERMRTTLGGAYPPGGAGFRARPAESLEAGDATDLLAHIRRGLQIKFTDRAPTQAQTLADEWASHGPKSAPDLAAGGASGEGLAHQPMLPGTEFGEHGLGAMTPDDLATMRELAQTGVAEPWTPWPSRMGAANASERGGLGPEWLDAEDAPQQLGIPGVEHTSEMFPPAPMTADDLAQMQEAAATGRTSSWPGLRSPVSAQRQAAGYGGAMPPGAPVPVPPGTPWGGSLKQFGLKSLPGMASGTAAAVGTWNADQDDGVWQRLLLSALAFEAGAGVPHVGEATFLGAKAAGQGGKVAGGLDALKHSSFEAFVNNLLGPNVGVLKIANDVTNGVAAPFLNFARSLVAGSGELLHGNVGTAARTVWSGSLPEMAAYYTSVAAGKGLTQGFKDAWDILNPANAEHLSELTSSQNTRLIRSVQALFEPLLEHAEQASIDVATRNGSALAPAAPGLPGMTSDLARERAAKTFMTGTPEGITGRAYVALIDSIQKQFGGYGRMLEPFKNVPANLLDHWISSIPGIGLGNAVKGLDPETVAARQLMAMATIPLIRGHFETTGGGPMDPTMYQEWARDHQANSVRVPGSDLWVPINKIPVPQVRAALSMEAILQDAKINPLSTEDWTSSAKWMRATEDLGKQLAGESFLPPIMGLLSAVQRGDLSQLPSAVAGQATAFIPNHLAKYAVSQEGVKADTKGTALQPERPSLMDQVGAEVQSQIRGRMPVSLDKALPFLGGAAPDKLTAGGKQVQNAQQGLAALSPLPLSHQANDPLEQFYQEIGMPIPQAPKSIAIPVSPHNHLDLSGEEKEAYLRARGQLLDSVLGGKSSQVAARINDAGSPLARQEMLKRVEDRLDTEANRSLLAAIIRKDGRDTFIQRVKEAETARTNEAAAGRPGLTTPKS